MRLGRSDLEGALDLVREAGELESDVPFPVFWLEQFVSLVRCSEAVYCEIDRTRRRAVILTGTDTEPELSGAVEAYWATCDEHPLHLYRTRTGDLGAAKIYDVVTPRQLRKTQFYSDYLRPFSTPFLMSFRLPAPGGSTRTFLFARDMHDFGERERALLDLLRPHLAQIRSAVEARRRARATLDIAPDDFLTAREAEVLDRVAEGLTNRKIAEELWISPGTVRRHLDNIYAKLDAHTRTAAVRIARERASL